MAIIGLKIYIAMKPLIKTISDAFGGSNQSSLDTFAGFMSGVGDAVAFVITQVTPLLVLFGKAIGIFIDIEQYLSGLATSFFDAGSSIITGLIDGVSAGAGKAVSAVKGVGQSMLDQFTGLFGIHSPSAVMAKMGGHLMGGLDKGIAANDSGAGKAMADAVQPVAARGGGGSTSVSFGAGSIVITVSGSNGAEVAAQLREVLPGELAAAFESMGITAGAA
jgi:phage-related protein